MTYANTKQVHRLNKHPAFTVKHCCGAFRHTRPMAIENRDGDNLIESNDSSKQSNNSYRKSDTSYTDNNN